MKKTYGYPALAVILGAVCCALRRRQLLADFDADLLPVPGLATHVLTALTLLTLVGFALLMLPIAPRRDWNSTVGTGPLLPLRVSALLCAAAAVLLATAKHPETSYGAVLELAMLVLPVLMVVGAVAGAVGLWLAAGGGAKAGQNFVLPSLLGCFWVVSAYHSYATDPVVLHFVWFLLCVAFGALGWYEFTALAIGRGHGRVCFYLSLVTVVLSMTALAGGETLANQLLLFAQLICFLTLSVKIAREL